MKEPFATGDIVGLVNARRALIDDDGHLSTGAYCPRSCRCYQEPPLPHMMLLYVGLRPSVHAAWVYTFLTQDGCACWRFSSDNIVVVSKGVEML